MSETIISRHRVYLCDSGAEFSNSETVGMDSASLFIRAFFFRRASSFFQAFEMSLSRLRFNSDLSVTRAILMGLYWLKLCELTKCVFMFPDSSRYPQPGTLHLRIE